MNPLTRCDYPLSVTCEPDWLFTPSIVRWAGSLLQEAYQVRKPYYAIPSSAARHHSHVHEQLPSAIRVMASRIPTSSASLPR